MGNPSYALRKVRVRYLGGESTTDVSLGGHFIVYAHSLRRLPGPALCIPAAFSLAQS